MTSVNLSIIICRGVVGRVCWLGEDAQPTYPHCSIPFCLSRPRRTRASADMSAVCRAYRAPCVRPPSLRHRRDFLSAARRPAASPWPWPSSHGGSRSRLQYGTVFAEGGSDSAGGGGGGGGDGGVVHLIGAGPGGLDNLTVRALRLLRNCDAVVYDDLGAADMIDEVPADADRIYVGKRGGKEGSWKQRDIDQLLVRLCLEGRNVARLKGGCPSVFSRAHSEIAALTDAGCEFDMVPG